MITKQNRGEAVPARSGAPDTSACKADMAAPSAMRRGATPFSHRLRGHGNARAGACPAEAGLLAHEALRRRLAPPAGPRSQRG